MGYLLLFLASLLTVLSAYAAPLWILAVLVGEQGHWAAVFCLILLTRLNRRAASARLNATLIVAAAILFLRPWLNAEVIAYTLPDRCSALWGHCAMTRTPLRMRELFFGYHSSRILGNEYGYWKEGNDMRHMDFYLPSPNTNRPPVVIVIHGGSWGGGNKGEIISLDRALAADGYAVAAINYRLAPDWPFPAAVDDVFHAIDYLKTNAERLKVDASRIVLLGRSAGGQIALSAAYAEKESAIRGVVSLYGPTDMVLGYTLPSRRWVLDSKKALNHYLRGNPEEQPELYKLASPIALVGPTTPPTLLIHGGLDPIVWPVHSIRLGERLQAFHRPYLYLALPWATHGCEAIPNGPSAQLSLYAIERFLEGVFKSA